jgi:hypothetical protein
VPGYCDLPLHGMTVVVDTDGPRVYIGRYDHDDPDEVVLNDVEVKDFAPGERKEAYLARAARVGVFVNTRRLRVPHSEVASIRKLSEIEAEA